jgi:hypothetical protein
MWDDFHFGEDTIVDGDVDFTFVIVFVTITIGVHPTHDHFVFIVCCFGILMVFFLVMFLLLLFLWIEKKPTNKVSPIIIVTY